MAVKRNLISNYLGQGWVALMSLAFIPLYIKYLGIEAYGLIGLFALFQAWLSFLDMGMTPTMGREMARFTGGAHNAQTIRDLLRSIEVIATVIALLIAFGIALSANWIASAWVKAEEISIDVIAQAFTIMGFVTALRFIEGIYRSAIVGLQRQVMFNVVNSAMATLRGAGAVVILALIAPSIEAFFIWQGTMSIATLVILASATYQTLPSGERSGRFSWSALLSIWRFASGMLGITILALLLTQVDKILLSRLLSLSEYGYYTLAATVASALYMCIGPITQAWYPRMCELYARNEQTSLAEIYHQSAQLVSVVAGSAAIVLVFYSETLLRLWTQDPELAARTAPLLSLLALGNLLNGLMNMPYMAQLATGWTSLTARINIIAVILIIPAIIWVTPKFGALGAAWVWVALNVGYVLMGINYMHRKILKAEKWRWYIQDILKPLAAGLLGSQAVALLWPEPSGNVQQLAQLALAIFFTLTGSLLFAKQTRIQVFRHFLTYSNKLKIPNDH